MFCTDLHYPDVCTQRAPLYPTVNSAHFEPVATLQVPWVLLSTLAQRETPFAKHSKALLGGSTTLTLAGPQT